MRKTALLNSQISEVISKMGHTDTLAIGDCGLPIPDGTKRIDIALIKNIPGFLETLTSILTELQIEEVIVAKETFEVSPQLFNDIKIAVGDVKITFITHEELKSQLKECKAVVRTGEQTPYANVILKSGVVF
ncbi:MULTISPECIES: D-ribose pyranase [Clostridium]|uniref:D-ribose pyranase n=1 Tax=Clostridium tagluense TaxID=360422 RepID=A0A401UMG0_9CLOT|nr:MULTISPECIES: D-ribose pyranase [Clostridium]MBZ9635374.1 D-ribose pyranase [Clostridium sp. FP1]MCB2298286.1 D-ribose pyranase [Clostridium tagluense]GCD10708.1 D-ribose pyranase [Clostridium tagluense]